MNEFVQLVGADTVTSLIFIKFYWANFSFIGLKQRSQHVVRLFSHFARFLVTLH